METNRNPSVATPIIDLQLTRIKVNRSQTVKLTRDLILAWSAFTIDANAENAKKLDDAKLRAEIFLREVNPCSDTTLN